MYIYLLLLLLLYSSITDIELPPNYIAFGLVWFLCLMAYQLFVGYLMPKPFSLKNSSGTI